MSGETHACMQPDSPAAWRRLALCVAVCAAGGVGMWSIVVALPAVQADFGVARGLASAPYTLTMISFAVGGVYMGRIADRRGVVAAILLGAVVMAAGYALTALARNFALFALFQGVLVGFGSSATFAPLVADISHWFERRRGIAVAICAAGNYLAGVVWPPVLQHFIAADGWRATHAGAAVFSLVALPLLATLLRRGEDSAHAGASQIAQPARLLDSGLPLPVLQALLVVAGVACCVAMSMPQVHIVAYCGDLGYGPARGAEMLSLMLGFGIVSRIASGFLADRIGGVPTLLVGSFLQGVALLLYTLFDSLGALYVISALFGLFQGGIVPSYAIIVREYFDAKEAGARVGAVIMATLFGMAFGGWGSGWLFDLTGNYHAAFVNGLAWNLLNVSIASFLLTRSRRMQTA
ncbi:MAG: MFS transporter [Hyphomicrobiales bacterium]|nr:MFS transporter [Hyphomicrobiales bacterium]